VSDLSALAGRRLLITGASRGLGRAAAEAAAKAGAQLVLIGRTVGGLEEVDDLVRRETGASALLVPHDLRELDALDQLGAQLFERYGRLDGLILAHGTLGQLSPLGHIPPQRFAEVFAVNATACYRLIRSLDPLLRQSDAGRIALVTDRTMPARAYWGVYAASKLAAETLLLAYAEEQARGKVRGNLFAAPPMRTALRAKAYPGEDAESLPEPAAVVPSLLALMLPDESRNGALVTPG